MQLIRLIARGLAIAVLAACAGCPYAGIPTGDTTAIPTGHIGAAAEGTGPSLEDILSSSPPAATATPPCIGETPPTGLAERAMLDALNLYRARNGLAALKYSKRLEAAAQNHLQDMAFRDYFDHVSPEGTSPGDRALAAGFCHRYVGENLAAGQIGVAAVMEAWKRSPAHNMNMLQADYVYVGMCCYQAPNGRFYWAQEFAIEMP